MKWSLLFILFALGLTVSHAACTRRTLLSSTFAVSSKMVNPSTKEAALAAPLATWIWNTTLITDESQVSQFFSFAQEQDLQRAYLHINADIDNQYFASFIRQCNASGIVVEALMGNPRWILGGGYPRLQSNLDWIEQYQGNVSGDAKFAGIHMDVEVCIFLIPTSRDMIGR